VESRPLSVPSTAGYPDYGGPHPPLVGLSLADLRSVAVDLGEAPFRGNQLYGWIYGKKAANFEVLTNLSKGFRQALAERFVLGRREPLSVAVSSDGTRKYLFPVGEPPATGAPATGDPAAGPPPTAPGAVESALIPEGERLTLCLSTQVGCRRGCLFCQTGKQGFQGNLGTGDILNQFLSLPERDEVTNIVFMGMGEPLDNLDATLRSLELLTDPEGIGLSSRRITVSTVGIHPALEEFLEATKVNLAVSLHSPFPEERRALMPVEASHPLSKTIALLRRRREDTARKLSMEYTLFAGLNDTPRHAEALARLLSGLSLRVNLIPYHPIDAGGGTTRPGTTGRGTADSAGLDLRPPSPAAVAAFQQELRNVGLRTFTRRSRGQDIGAACGMLWTGGNGGGFPRLEVEPLSSNLDR
jgi:23S rRNA (adenine2503-C2)-methyltransferase